MQFTHWLRRGRPRTSPGTLSAPRRLITVTDAQEGTAHLVTIEAMEAGHRTAERRYAAVCGTDVLPASLTTSERRPCTGCRRWFAAHQRGPLGGT
ncbi:MAG TPA: hypothetical protein VFO16_22640 [Pseudonocardiaceae bacterium]|nr:hypothetical protein [Pseudonocardiaceae bacterium]